MPSYAEVLSLYRSLIRQSKRFTDYNIREYALRKTREDFRQNAKIDPKQAEAAYEQGLNQLELVKRQATVYSLFAAPLKSIMDK
mmetsp:Transcript_11255/g.41216  ORF Transcript_11255/g.41216 Transcript_11255/m.41216 type:complete len:84 (+) Transcript_11255:296-547(+)